MIRTHEFGWRVPAVLAGALSLIACGNVSAQPAYPVKPVRMIIPFPPGGGTDIVSRQVAARMSEGLGQQVIVDNRPGAGGTIGAELGVTAQPDGYTIVMVSAAYSANPALYKLPYDPVYGISTISMIGSGPLLVAVNPAVPAKNIPELVAYAKANPEKSNYASAGQGGLSHLATELFNMSTGTQFAHIPYKGTGPALTDLIGGRVQVMFGNVVAAIGHVKTGKLRGIAVTSLKRIPAMPDLPTVAESGLPDYEALVWFGVWAPPKMPKPVVERLNAELRRVVVLPVIRDRLALEGLDAAPSSPEEFTVYLKTDIEKWTRVVRAVGIKAE